MNKALRHVIALSAVSLFSAGCKSWDVPAYEYPVILGSDGSSGRIAIVYHPGATAFTKSMVRRLGEELASRGYIAALFTANPGLSLDQASYTGLVIGSPVYGAEIRPPVKDFIFANAPFSIPIFALLTACIKIASGSFEPEIKKRIAYLCDAIDGALGND
jgi:flavodoxin